jgi:hypothetical protein
VPAAEEPVPTCAAARTNPRRYEPCSARQKSAAAGRASPTPPPC